MVRYSNICPQKRHFRAAALMVSAQSGQTFVSSLPAVTAAAGADAGGNTGAGGFAAGLIRGIEDPSAPAAAARIPRFARTTSDAPSMSTRNGATPTFLKS